jgi:acetyl-CoA carboxylase biotin carboxyl carrier protein
MNGDRPLAQFISARVPAASRAEVICDASQNHIRWRINRSVLRQNTTQKGTNMDLTEDDVLQILKLIDESKFDYFQLEVGELKIKVSKGDPIPVSASPATASPGPAVSKPAVESRPAASAPAAAAVEKEAPKPRGIPEGMLAITAPLLGTFYVAPEPGAAPFVKVGETVTEDTTVGLIEVMKVFNSVRAAVNGTVAEVLAKNGQFVEYGQPLFLVKPA